jgi:hypothetical protein
MRRLLCLFRGHQWRIEENHATQGTEQECVRCEPTGRCSLVTRDSDQGSRPPTTATRATPAAEEHRGIQNSSCISD